MATKVVHVLGSTMSVIHLQPLQPATGGLAMSIAMRTPQNSGIIDGGGRCCRNAPMTISVLAAIGTMPSNVSITAVTQRRARLSVAEITTTTVASALQKLLDNQSTIVNVPRTSRLRVRLKHGHLITSGPRG